MADSWLFLLLLALCLLCWFWRQHQSPKPHPAAVRTTVQRLLKPRTPDDRPQCRREKTPAVFEIPTRLPIRPWSEVKSRRGVPKHIDTQGFVCDNRACLYC